MIYDILDARSNEIRPGPYSKEGADRMCELLNRFVAQNTIPLVAAMATKIVGPFYPRERR